MMNNLQTTPQGKIVVHRPIFNPTVIEQHYSQKDGVAVKYVCTTELVGDYGIDIFYRASPHPEFGNFYFGLYLHQTTHITITNADMVEELEFGMIKDGVGHYHYSPDTMQPNGEIETTKFKVREGEFYCG